MSKKLQPLDPADFDHWLGDWDSDGIANIDDPNPLVAGDKEPISKAELAPQFISLLEKKNRYLPVLKSTMRTLSQIAPKATVKGRIKEMYSTIGKLIRKRVKFDVKTAGQGEQYTTGLTDLAGCMVVTQSQEELEEVVKHISSGKVGEIFEHEDKYAEPANGYRAHHFILVQGEVPVEVQVKTERMSKISAASHYPYKNGKLNGEFMLKATDLALQADQGDRESANQIDELIKDVRGLERLMTLRENPDEEQQIGELQTAFEESVKKLALVISLGKFPLVHQEEAIALFRSHGQIIGVDFDGVFDQVASEKREPATTQPATKKDRGLEAKSERAKADIELKTYDAIQLKTAERRKANEAAIKVLQKEDRAITIGDINILRQYTGAGGIGYSDEEKGSKRGLLNEHYTSYKVVQLIWDKLVKMGVKGGNILEPGSGVGNFAGFLPGRESFRMLMIERSAISSRIASLLYPQQVVKHEDFAMTELSAYNLTGAVGNVPFGDIKIHRQSDPLARYNPRIHDYFILKSLDALLPGGFMAVITSIGTMDKKDPALRQAMVERAKFVGAYRLPSTAFKHNADTLVTTDLIIFQKYPDHDSDRHPDYHSDLNRVFAFNDLSVATKGANGERYHAYYNPYYDQHPDHILGDHIQGHDVQFLSRMGVKGELTQSVIQKVLGDQLSFPYELPKDVPLYDIPDEGVMLETGRDYHPGNIVLFEGKFYEKQRLYYKPITLGSGDKAGDGLRGRIESACNMLDKYDDFVTALAQDSEQKQPYRSEFKKLLAGHLETYGLPDEDNRIREVFKFDNRLYKLTTLVKRDPVNGELVYADIIDAQAMFNRNYTPSVTESGDLSELAVYGRSIGEQLNMEFYQSVYKGGTATIEEIHKQLEQSPDFFYNPESGNHEFKYAYLAGDIRHKLRIARQHDLQKNIKALESVIPEWVDVYNINVDPRHIFTYLPTIALKQWIKEDLHYDEVQIGLIKDKGVLGGKNQFNMRIRQYGAFIKSGEEQAEDINAGWGHTPFSRIVNSYIKEQKFPLNFFDGDGNIIPGMTESKAKEMGEEGEALLAEAKKIQGTNNNRMLLQVPDNFNEWLRTRAGSKVRELVEEAYNNEYNAVINPVFDGQTLRVRGMSDTFYGVKDFTLYKHNRAVAEKLVWNQKGANCHDVGAGKTLASIITSQVLIQQGTAKKQMFVVPGKVQEKWVEEYSMLFPDAKILNMKMKSGSKHKELTMAQLYNWDAIFIADHAFKSLSLSPKVQAKMYQERVIYFDEMIEDFGQLIDEDQGVTEQTKKSLVRRLEKMKEEFEAKLKDVSTAKRLDTDIFFDELGVDCLFFDEAHFYKNALGSGKAQKLGIGASKPSQRAEDVLQKTKWLFDKIGHKNVFVLTATPVVNSPIEVWHMLNLCAPDLLREYNIDHLDNFINLFVKEEEKMVKKTNGEYRTEQVVSGYYNLPEMRSIIDKVMDIKSYDQLIQFYSDHPDYLYDDSGKKKMSKDGKPKVLAPKFKRPAGNTRREIVEPSAMHTLLFDDIILRANLILQAMSDPNKETKDNFLVLTGDGSKVATDLRIYDNGFDGVKSSILKIGKLTENVMGGYHARSNPGLVTGAQDIYGDFFNRAGRERIRENPASEIRNQIIFCDWISIEGLKKPGSFHQLLKTELVKTGFPRKEICIINGGIIGTNKDGSDYLIGNKDDKEALKKQAQDDFNSGHYRLIIGNQSIAEGMNLQQWTTALHHMDVPYTPSQIQQRNGRGLRQGNNYGTVDIHYYLMQDSFDQYRLELVSKKQNWIDDLFFGSDRQVDTDDGGSSLEFEQMVAATNSDPRVKDFFEARANTKELSSQITSLKSEVHRLEGSLKQATQDVNAREERLSSTVQREKALQDAQLPDSPSSALSNSQFAVNYSYYNGTPESVELNLSTDGKQIPGHRQVTSMEVPESNPNARILYHLIPDSEHTSRAFYNKSMWSSIKKMAQPELKEAFGWSMDEKTGSGRSVTGNQGNIIATEEDFYEHYGVDMDAEKKTKDSEGKPVSYGEIKRRYGMFDMQAWQPVVTEKLAKLFIALEKAWQRTAQARLETLSAELERSKKTLSELERVLKTTRDKHASAVKGMEKNQKTVVELQDVVNELVKTQYEERDELYEELNRIAPKYGVTNTIHVRDVGVVEHKESRSPAMRENSTDTGIGGVKAKNKPPVIKTLYESPLVYSGIVKELELLDENGHMQRIEAENDDLAMIFDAEGTTIYIFPTERIKLVTGAVDDQAAEKMFEEFHHFASDQYDYELNPPQGAELLSAGHAERIMYVSDKVIYAGDEKGKDNHYFHYFDQGERPIYKYGDLWIIANVNIDGRGILN